MEKRKGQASRMRRQINIIGGYEYGETKDKHAEADEM
jgi:hypothetical protein